MDSNRDRAISRVRKLRALAGDKAATGPEAALAKERADALMAKHSLGEADVAPEPTRRTPPVQPPPNVPVYGFGQGFIFGYATVPTGTANVPTGTANVNAGGIHIIFS